MEKKFDLMSPMEQTQLLRNEPAPHGLGVMEINGKEYDLRDLEEYVIKAAPANIATIVYHKHAKIMEKTRRKYLQIDSTKFNWKLFLLLVGGIGVAFLMIFIVPKMLSG